MREIVRWIIFLALLINFILLVILFGWCLFAAHFQLAMHESYMSIQREILRERWMGNVKKVEDPDAYREWGCVEVFISDRERGNPHLICFGKGEEFVDLISEGDSALKEADSDLVVIMKRDGRRIEGQLKLCTAWWCRRAQCTPPKFF